MFKLDKYLTERRNIIDKALDDALPPETTKPAVLHKAMRYAVKSGGKRIRPVLCMTACECLAAPYTRAIHPAVSVELLHTYTLIHDDLPCMDDDDFRRGKPTVHKAFGEANAVLAGDALQALAFEELSKTGIEQPYTTSMLISALASAVGSMGIIGGQVEDISSESQRSKDINTLYYIHFNKTAQLFKASMRLGAMAGAATPDQLAALTDFGCHLGLAFQLIDDILDSEQDNAGEIRKDPKRKKTNDKGNLSCLSFIDRKTALKRSDDHLSKATSVIEGMDKNGVEPLKAIAKLVRDQIK